MPAIKTADRVVVRVTATESGDWQVVSVPTGFQGITSQLFADNDLLHGFVVFENGEDWEVYDGDGASSFLEVLSVSGTVVLARPATPSASSNNGDRVNAGSGTHTLAIGLGASSLTRFLRETNPTWKTFPAGDPTPSVSGHRFFRVSGATAITRFDDASPGQLFFVRRGDEDVVITGGAGIDLGSAASMTLTTVNPVALFAEDSGTCVHLFSTAGDRLFSNAGAALRRLTLFTNTDDDFGDYQASSFDGALVRVVGRQSEGRGSPIISSVQNDNPANSAAFPAAVIGYAEYINNGNSAFGVFGRAKGKADAGNPIGGEFNGYNESDSDCSAEIFPDQSFSTTAFVGRGIIAAAGRDSDPPPSGQFRDVHTGVRISKEGGTDNSTGFKYGLLATDLGGRLASIVTIQGANSAANHRHHIALNTIDGAGPPVFEFRKDRNFGEVGGAAISVAGDIVGRMIYKSRDNTVSGPQPREYAYLDVIVVDPAAGSETGKFSLKTRVNGFGPTEKVSVQNGVSVGGAADRGAGSIALPAGAATNGLFVGEEQIISGTKVGSFRGGVVSERDASASGAHRNYKALATANDSATAQFEFQKTRADSAALADDVIGRISAAANDTGVTSKEFAYIDFVVDDATAGSEDGRISIKTRREGLGPTEKFSVGSGFTVGGATDLGIGTINMPSNGYVAVGGSAVLGPKQSGLLSSASAGTNTLIDVSTTTLPAGFYRAVARRGSYDQFAVLHFLVGASQAIGSSDLVASDTIGLQFTDDRLEVTGATSGSNYNWSVMRIDGA